MDTICRYDLTLCGCLCLLMPDPVSQSDARVHVAWAFSKVLVDHLLSHPTVSLGPVSTDVTNHKENLNHKQGLI